MTIKSTDEVRSLSEVFPDYWGDRASNLRKDYSLQAVSYIAIGVLLYIAIVAGLIAVLTSFMMGLNICFLTILSAVLLLSILTAIRFPATSFRRYIENATGMHCTLNGKTCLITAPLITEVPESFTDKREEYLKLSAILSVVMITRIVMSFAVPVFCFTSMHDITSVAVSILMLAALSILTVSDYVLGGKLGHLIEGTIKQLETMISIPDPHEEFGRPRIFSWSASNDEITITYGYELSL